MSKKETLESPTREQVLKAAESCPDAETALKELYPSVFGEEWEDVTKAIQWTLDDTSREFYYLIGTDSEEDEQADAFTLDQKGIEFNYGSGEERYRLEKEKNNNILQGFRIMKKT